MIPQKVEQILLSDDLTDMKLMIELPPVDSERSQEIIILLFNCSRQDHKNLMIENVQCGTVQVSMMLLI